MTVKGRYLHNVLVYYNNLLYYFLFYYNSWIKYEKTIGKISQSFNIILEILPTHPPAKGATVAFDNIKLKQCFPESNSVSACTPHQYRCSQTNECINNTRVCDITEDCQNGDDETQNCGKLSLFLLKAQHYLKTFLL